MRRSHVVNAIVRLALILLGLVLALRILHNPQLDDFGADDTFAYGEGNGTDSVRARISDQLRVFQEGYAARDVSRADDFARQLFSQDEMLILGTMPAERYEGFEAATGLVQSDWESWGDCTFLIERSRISVRDGVAWIAMRGEVEFDLSRFIVMPLRLTGVMVNEAGVWRFQQLQFQFDLDLSFLLLLAIVLAIWLAVEMIVLLARSGAAILRSSRARGA